MIWVSIFVIRRCHNQVLDKPLKGLIALLTSVPHMPLGGSHYKTHWEPAVFRVERGLQKLNEIHIGVLGSLHLVCSL